MNDLHALIQQAYDKHDDERWNLPWFITITLPNPQLSLGDVWTAQTNGIEKLLRIDPDATYVLSVCSARDDRGGRPHTHGVVRTSVAPERIKKCFYEMGTWVMPIHDIHGLTEYIQKQAVPDTFIHNLEK